MKSRISGFTDGHKGCQLSRSHCVVGRHATAGVNLRRRAQTGIGPLVTVVNHTSRQAFL